MDHNIVLSYDYSNRNRWQRRTNASVAGHFDGHGGAPVPYGAHLLMQHDQGLAGSHWTPPLGNFLLRIAPVAARVTANETTMQHVPTLLAILMAVAMRRYNTAHITQWRRFVAFTKTTKHHHWASTHSDITKPDTLHWLFRTSHREKELQVTCRPLITIGV